MNSAFVKPATRRLRQPLLQIVVRNLRSLGLRLERLAPLLEDKEAEARGHVLHRGYRLPPKSMRGRMCGDAFRTDSFFFLSAVLEATKFPDRLGYTKESRVVDIGSGLGRLATGLLAEFGEVQYLGDVEAYNREIARILRPGGRCFLTAFAEDGVADVTFNPTDYVPYACDGPLTVVRYSRPWLFSGFQRQGLQVEDFRYHGSMFPKQSEIYLVKR